MRKSEQQLKEVNEKLEGALEATPTWHNEHAKSAPAEGFGGKIAKTLAWVKGFRLIRALQRYGVARGGLLAGGIAYSAMFAIAGVLAIALTAFSALFL